jgi:hypothetical protein
MRTVVIGAEDQLGNRDAAKRHLTVGLESPLAPAIKVVVTK